MNYHVRPMQEFDIVQVSEIDREAFPTQYPPPNFKKDLNNGVIRYLVACNENAASHEIAEMGEAENEANSTGLLSRIWGLFDKGNPSEQGVTAGLNHNVLGYAAMWLMVDEAHLTSIAVRESHRRRGIGEMLLTSIIDLALELNAQIVTLEVRESNMAAQALYQKYGFIKVGVRRGYYSDDGENAVIMTAEEILSASYQAMLQELKQKNTIKYDAGG